MDSDLQDQHPEPDPTRRGHMLHARVVRHFKRERVKATETILGWRALSDIKLERHYQLLFKFDDFYAYFAAKYNLSSQEYIDRCLPVGGLPLALFLGSVVPVSALVYAAQLGPFAMAALADCTRQRIDLRCERLIDASRTARRASTDEEAALLLRSWLLEDKDIALPSKSSSSGEPELPSANQLAAMIRDCIDDAHLRTAELMLRMTEGDLLNSRRRGELRARLMMLAHLISTCRARP